MLVGTSAFKWFEAFDGSVNLCVSDVLEGSARGRVVIMGINVIGGRGGEEETVI